MPAPSFILALQLLSCAGFVRTLSAAGVVDAEPITLRKARPFAVIVFGFIGTLYSNITALKVSPMPGCPMPHQRLYYQSHKIKCCCLHPRRSHVHVTVAHFAPMQAPLWLPSAWGAVLRSCWGGYRRQHVPVGPCKLRCAALCRKDIVSRSCCGAARPEPNPTGVPPAQYVPVDTIICFRASMPLIIAVIEWMYMDRELPSARSWASMLSAAPDSPARGWRSPRVHALDRKQAALRRAARAVHVCTANHPNTFRTHYRALIHQQWASQRTGFFRALISK